eukprot:Gregarina_sp_Poly_1__1644@NODE_141_length_12988_cov_478_019271_g126_i0_p2_GENE_NODE_141_length_12988_cov_478_019271_g126_i0NODE_141_length_12988_cov_478_019271_g126_i0_p2_ORF_typecomplete_len653_score72_99Reprolysin_4/PF13583_6/0_00025PPC/PF04151_15/0_0055Reprolysin_3/PF13582_6/6_6e03Reprolysin_3/PF13582_6/0_021Peptidase_M66/PF10462_9/0_037Peptidase_M54/PF07998_11/0_29_NODE_141_length_12988_cov_478_019271_g126_i060177975
MRLFSGFVLLSLSAQLSSQVEARINFAELETIFNVTNDGRAVLELEDGSTWDDLSPRTPRKLVVRREAGWRQTDIVIGHLSFGVVNGIFGDVVVARQAEEYTIQTMMSNGESWTWFGSSLKGTTKKIFGTANGFDRIDFTNPPTVLALASNLADVDRNGRTVIDILCAFTPRATSIIADIEGYCAVQVHSANQAFANSGIASLRLRPVEAVKGALDFETSEKGLAKASQEFTLAQWQSGADIVAVFGSSNDENALHGFSYFKGDLCLQNVESPSVFRHSIGHIAGLLHCGNHAGATGISHGYHNGLVGTVMCGNTLNFFSNPSITINGRPIGDVSIANAVAHWAANQNLLSRHMPSLVPLEDERHEILFQTTHSTPKFRVGRFHVPGNLLRMVAVVHTGQPASGRLALYLRAGNRNVTTTIFDDSSEGNGFTSITVLNPVPGTWTAGVLGSDVHNNDLKVTVHGYRDKRPLVGGDPDYLNCFIVGEPGPAAVGFEKWIDASRSFRGDGTKDHIDFKWRILSGREKMHIMPGGDDVPTTLLNFDKDVPFDGKIQVTCADAIHTKIAEISVGEDGIVTTEMPTTPAPSTTGFEDIPEWNPKTQYSPCSKVRHEGLVYLNGWSLQGGLGPQPNQLWSAWRQPADSEFHAHCQPFL